jgi:dUTP pyrophosphatase
MKIKILDKAMPEVGFSTKGSVGMDLRACSFNGNVLDEYTLEPGKKVSVGTGVIVDMSTVSSTCGAILLPRSGLGTKHDLVLANTIGLIDTDYHGEIIAVLRNNSDRAFSIKKYDRVAQLSFLTFVKPETFEIVEEFDTSEEFTQRGSNGFGSTGTQ